MSEVNIAICGKFRSGKDTVGKYLCDNYGYKRFAFGDGIRRVTRELYPHLYEGNAKPRALLQGFGQMARQFDENVWVDDCFRRIDEAAEFRYGYKSGKTPRAVITDLRQPNEYDALKQRGYIVIRVIAPDEHRKYRAITSGDAFTDAELTHETESHVDGFAADYVICNNGTLEQLYPQIDTVMADLGVKKATD
jgi:dephospho-CoA kinase